MTSDAGPSLLAAAIALNANGFSILPLLPGSKFPAVAWKRLQSTRATPPTLERWFANTRSNLGVVLGAVSGNAVALDFDSGDLARLVDLERLARITWVEQTPGGGFHIIVRVRGEIPRTTTHIHHGLPLDLKSEASFVVVAPSTLGPGQNYRLLSPELRVATVDRQEIDALVARLEAAWPAVRTPCLRVGRQGALDDFGEGRERRPSILTLAPDQRSER